MADDAGGNPITPEMERRRDRQIETEAGWPTSHSMVKDLLRALGLHDGAYADSPYSVWDQALAKVRQLRGDAGG